ncbi:MAG: hypothetical protein IJM30_09430 [Thermoguttaceae bacterium]|nr:hypothetical protein [Thermoguttaceae bacterium]
MKIDDASRIRAAKRAFARATTSLLASFALGASALALAQDLEMPAMDPPSDAPAPPGAGTPPQGAPPQRGGAPANRPDAGSQGSSQGQGQGRSQAQDRSQASDAAGDAIEAQLVQFFKPARRASEIEGRDLTLERLLYGVSSPAARRDRLIAHWDLSGKYAEFNLSSLRQTYVEECISQLSKKYSNQIPPDATALALATRNGAKATRDEARLRFAQAQSDFDAAFSTPAGRRASDATTRVGDRLVALYVPATLPTAKTYATRYEEISARRRLSAEATRLNALLPSLYETLRARADQRTVEWSLLKTEFGSASSTAVSLFDAVDRYCEACRELIEATVRYNIAIAIYSCETTPGNVRGEALLATLNQRPSSAGQGAQSSQRTQPSAEPRPGTTSASFDYGARGLVLPGLLPRGTATESASLAWGRPRGLILPGLDLYALDSDAPVASDDAFAYEPLEPLPLAEPNSTGVQLANVSLSPDSAPALLLASYSAPGPLASQIDDEAKKAAEEEAARKAAEEEAARKAAEEAAKKAAEEEVARKAAEEEAARKAAEEAAKKAAEEEAARKAAEEAAKKAAEEEAARKAAEEAAKKAAEEEAKRKAEEEAKKKAEEERVLAQSAPTFDPFVVTGYERLDPPPAWAVPQPAPNPAPSPVAAPEQAAPIPDGGVYWKEFDARADRLFAELLPSERSDEPASGLIVRGQQGFDSYAPAGQQGSVPSYDSAKQAAAATPEPDYKRAQLVAEAYFAPQAPRTDEQTGASERSLSLRDALSRVPRAPEPRLRVVLAYWELQSAFASNRIEEIVYSRYLAALKTNDQNEFLKAKALGAQARWIESKTRVRDAQSRLLRAIGVSPQYGYPVPTTIPFCGKRFDLASPRRVSSAMARAAALIPERLRSAQEIGAKLGDPQSTLALDLAQATEIQTPIATLEKQRELVLAYIKIVIELNEAIAEYVAYYPANVSNDQFARALSGVDK